MCCLSRQAWVDHPSDNVSLYCCGMNVFVLAVQQRIKACKDKGFVAIDPDNTDGYTTNTGFPLSAADALNFLTFISTTARSYGLGVGLKNTLGLINDKNLLLWDFAVNEECYHYNECDSYAPFAAGAWPCFCFYISLHSTRGRMEFSTAPLYQSRSQS